MDEAAEALTAFANIMVDTSSTFYSVGLEKGRDLIRKWGAQRVMFGSDYPMWQRNTVRSSGIMQRMFSDLIIDKGYNLFWGGISKAVWKGIGL